MTALNLTQEQEAFESAFAEEWWHWVFKNKLPNGDYRDLDVQLQWQGWQARAALAQSPVSAAGLTDTRIVELYTQSFNAMVGRLREAPKHVPDTVLAFARSIEREVIAAGASFPAGWREFIENIATPRSEPLNSVCVYRDNESRRVKMGELRSKAQELIAAADKGTTS